MTPHQIVRAVSDASSIGSVRRQAVGLAQGAGFAETEAGRVALVVTELATNLVRHAGGGRLMLQVVDESLLEVLSIDSGPGMNPEQALKDGYSSGGTAGQGLGAVRRLSAEFDVYSHPGKGCVVLSRAARTSSMLDQGATALAGQRWRWGAVTTPAPGEEAIGDTWRLRSEGSSMSMLVADGLGHGPLAAEASGTAARVFENEAFDAITPYFAKAHAAMRSTRGAAVAVAVCPGDNSQLTYCSIGNIAASILTRGGVHKRLMSHNGTVGAEMRTAKPLSYDWSAGDRLVAHSDGLTTRWMLKDYPDLMQYHPAVVAAVLHRDQLRGRDDATIVVLERMS